MASDVGEIQVGIALEVRGKRDVSSAITELERLQRKLAKVAIEEKSGAAAAGSLAKATQQAIGPLTKKTGNLGNATKVLHQYQRALKSATAEEIRGAKAMNQLGTLASANTRKFKRFSAVGLQQVGYQVGDLAVQLQGGTNAAVALGQQGSQLLGIFGPAGAILGAGLAIGTAIVAPLLEAKKAAKSLQDEVESLGKEIDSLGGGLDDLDFSSFSMNIGGTLLGLESSIMSDRLEKQIEKVFEDVDTQTSVEKTWKAIANDSIKTYGNWLSRGFISKDSIPSVFPTPEEAIERLGLDPNELGSTFFDQFQTALTDQDWGQLGGILDNLIAQIERLPEGVDGLSESGKIAVSSMISIAIQTEKAKTKADNLRWAWEKFGDQGASAVEEAVKLKEELGQGALEALELSNVDLESGIDAAAKKAAVLADKLGVSLGYATNIMELGTTVQSRMVEGKIATGEVPPWAAQDLPTVKAQQDILEKLNEDRRGRKDGSSGRGSSGGGASSATDAMERSYAKLMDRLNGVNPLVTKHREEVAKLKEWLDKGAISQTEYNTALSKLKEELNKNLDPLKKFKDQLEETLDPNANHMKGLEALNNALADFIFDPFENGVKGMVLQFSDAMRRMASEAIAARIMQSFIKSPLGGLFGGIFANGAAFSGGRVTPFASGGVVNGPTVFPMANGMGLMGEAGPEAVMPLKRDKSGRLGVEAQGSQMEAPQIKVVNIDDRASIGEYLEGPAGEKVVMNVLRRNGIVNR